jgi:hypothetical protein
MIARTRCIVRRSEDIIVPELDSILIRKTEPTKSEWGSNEWNDREIEILKREYPLVKSRDLRIIDLAKKLGKTYDSVHNKARRMSLT